MVVNRRVKMGNRIAELSDMEAVYSLRKLTAWVDTEIDLADEEGVRRFVEKAATAALGKRQAKDFMAVFDSRKSSAELSRACLTAIESDPDLLEEARGELDAVLAKPPKTQQMDLGISLGLLALAGMAMFLSGSLKIKTKNFELEYKGSKTVPEIFKAVLSKMPGWGGG